MAGTITVALRTAQSGILTHQAAIDAAANNIANVNTEGYSRKIVNMEQRVLDGVGAGVQLTQFTRAIDEGLLKDLRRELSAMNELDAQTTYYDRLQSKFGTPESNTSLSHIINEFAAAAESTANSPDSTLDKQQFVRWADEVALQFQNLSAEVQALRTQADKAISNTVDDINELTEKIADLNDKVIRNQAVSHDVTDLEDQRDMAISNLSELIDITYYQRGSGEFVVFTQNGSTLVDRTAKPLTHADIASLGASSTYSEGDITPIYVGAQVADNDITTSISGGKLAGLIEQRDTILPDVQAQIDELASELRSTLNQIHNRGTSYPGAQTLTGTRSFIDSADQQIKLDPSNGADDVAISLFNSQGVAQATTTLNTIMTSGAYGSGAQTSHGYWDIDEVASSIEDWLQDNGASSASVSVNSSGKFVLNVNHSSLNVAFRDQTATANGSTHEDASIGFDSDGDGDVDETVSGFSNFLGLNDLYVDGNTDQSWDSATMSTTFSGSAATLKFFDATAGVGSGNEIGTVSITASSSLSTIAKAINDGDFGVAASVVPDGSGQRLRLVHDTGKEMIVTQGSSDTLLTDLGISPTENGVSASLAVREDIKSTPSLLVTGKVQWDSDNSAYYTSAGDNTAMEEMAEALTSKNAFDTTGGLLNRSATFAEYAIDIIVTHASNATTNEGQLDTQRTLSESLQLKSATHSGVNMDEEMSNLILYQQAYTASARVISIVQQLFQVLNDAVQ